MTKVVLHNTVSGTPQPTPYYIQIDSAKIEDDIQAKTLYTLERMRSSGSQGTDSLTQFLDGQQRTRTITVTGYIDKYSNRTSATGLTASAMHDVNVVKERLISMADLGGTIYIRYGQGDGFYNKANSPVTYIQHECMIMKMKFTEDGSDHILKTADNEDYPGSSSVAIPIRYQVIITVELGENR